MKIDTYGLFVGYVSTITYVAANQTKFHKLVKIGGVQNSCATKF